MEASLLQNLTFLSLAAYLITLVIRTLAESISPQLKQARLYSDAALPLMPIIVGGFLGLATDTFNLASLSPTLLGSVLAGAASGMFSSFVYSKVRSWVGSGTSV